MDSIFLALAALALIGVISAQDYLYKPMRSESVSAGLTGPYHWWLDGSYVLLAAALVLGTRAHALMLALASLSALALLLTAATNTFSTIVDRVTGGQHALWHSRFTSVVFVSAIALELAGNHGALWALTALGIAAPGAMYGLTERSDYAEKLAVLGICVWLIAWAM